MAGKKNKKKQVRVKTAFSAHKAPPPPPSSACAPEVIPSIQPSQGACPTHPLIDASLKACKHLEKGVNIEKLSSKLSKAKLSITHCQDCSKDNKSGTGKKGKGRSNRKKAGIMIGQSAPNLQKKWVCLACGHSACGSPLTQTNIKLELKENGTRNETESDKKGAPMGHALKHSRCASHPIALQITDNVVCWCFTCNMAIDCAIDDNSQSVSTDSPLQAAVKIVHEKLSKEGGFLKDPGKTDPVSELVRCTVDEASQSASTLVLPPNPPISIHTIGVRTKRSVRGLMNLGNTCFFNSVMQNLLALDMLRNYFSSREALDGEGPLTSSLRKLYLETNLDGGGQFSTSSEQSGYESGLKKGGKGRALWEMNGGACNPRSLFGAICVKAPRFRGFQQQDSHELLRCLLDGLTSEERNARAKSASNGHVLKGTSLLVSNGATIPDGYCSNAEPSEGEKEINSSETRNAPSIATGTTIVEGFFGGQLCSTVCCCECGHSSVVYETMLDLSLQIPTQPTLKKGQKGGATTLWKPSSFGGGSQQRDTINSKVPLKASPGKVMSTSAVVESSKDSSQEALSAQEGEAHPSAAGGACPAKVSLADSSDFDAVNSQVPLKARSGKLTSTSNVVETTNKYSSQEALSAQGSEAHPLEAGGASVPKASSAESSTYDDVWLDFIGGGTQSAESSFQGSGDILKPVESSENNLMSDMKDFIGGSTQKTVLHGSTLADATNQNEQEAGFEAPEDAYSGVKEGTGVQDGTPCAERLIANTSRSSEDREVSSPALFCEGDNGPLPLASDVVLLSYEPLEATSTLEGVDSSALNDQVVKCSLMDMSSLPPDLDGDFDGFSQLFEEEESCSAVTQDEKTSVGNLEDYKAVEGGSWDDGGWEGETAVYGNKEEVSAGPQRLASYEDTIFPMSLEGCLADFTKPELLCGENAWECENCTERLKGKGKHSENACNDISTQGICDTGEDSGKGVKGGNKVLCINGTQEDNSKGYPRSSVETKESDGVLSEGCEDLACETNGEMKERSSVCGVRDHKMNGSNAQLSISDCGHCCKSQSLPCQADDSMDAIIDNQHLHMGESTAGMAKSAETIEAETHDPAVNSYVHVQSHVEEKTQGPCSNSEPTRLTALQNSNKEKLMSPLSKSIKEAKGKAKTKQHPEKLVKKDATKRLLISKAPLILTVHLKRFAQDMRGRLSKLSGHVSFPELLDLRPFLDPRCVDYNDCHYQLIGVVEHAGTMRGGHYIAYVRSAPVDEQPPRDTVQNETKDGWYYISDSSVRRASLEAILNSEAYLLFYEKCEVEKAD